MALDDFKSDEEEGEDRNSETQGNQHSNIHKTLDDLLTVKPAGDFDKHYNAKGYLVTVLYKLGFDVETDYEMIVGTDGRKRIECEVYGVKETCGETVEVIGEVGQYSYKRAINALNNVDKVLWVGEEFNERNVLVIEGSTIQKELIDGLPNDTDEHNQYKFIDRRGNEFVPDISSINTSYYCDVARVIILNVGDIRNWTIEEIAYEIQKDFKDTTEPKQQDIKKVLTELGYI